MQFDLRCYLNCLKILASALFFVAQNSIQAIFINLQFQLNLFSNKIVKMNSDEQNLIHAPIESTKKVTQKTNRYRLPQFQKEEWNLKRSYSPNKSQQRSVVNSENLQTNNCNFNETFLPKHSKISQHRQQDEHKQAFIEKIQQKQIVNHVQMTSKPKIPERGLKNQQLMTIQTTKAPKENYQTQTQNFQVPKEKQMNKVQSRLSIDRTLQFKLQPIQLKGNSFLRNSIEHNNFGSRRIKYHSSSNRYPDSQQFADISHQSDAVNNASLNMKAGSMHSLKKRKRLLKTKPAIHKSMKNVEKQIWQFLSNLSQKQQIDQVHKSKKKFKSKSKFKQSQRKLTELEKLNKSKLFACHLPKLPQNKDKNVQQDVDINYNMYEQLPPIHQDSLISQISLKQHESIIHRLENLIQPKQIFKKRNFIIPLEQYLTQYQLIKKVNPFFKKLNQLGGCILLSLGKFRFLDSSDLIFSQGDPISHLSIIILGKVLLTKTNNNFKTYSMPGESLGEEALFEQSKPYNLRLFSNSKSIQYKIQARTSTKVCILNINLRKFYKMSIELNSIGQKRLFNLIDNLFKINYLKKNGMVHNQLRQKLQTQIFPRRKTKSSFYFN